MSSVEDSGKSVAMSMFYIGINAGETLLEAIGNFLGAVKYANYQYAEGRYKDFLKERGYKFRKDINLVRVATAQEVEVHRVAVTQEDRKLLEQLSKKYGLDYSLQRRPDNLEELARKKYVFRQELSPSEERMLHAFTVRDPYGKPVRDPNNPGLPLLSKAEYVFGCSETQLANLEAVYTEMLRIKQKVPFVQRLKNAERNSQLHNMFAKRKRAKERNLNRGK